MTGSSTELDCPYPEGTQPVEEEECTKILGWLGCTYCYDGQGLVSDDH